MRRLKRKSWFLIAALWMAGSSAMPWILQALTSSQEAEQAESTLPKVVIRQLQNLPSPGPETPALTITETIESRPALLIPKEIESGSEIPGQGVLRLPDTYVDADIEQTGHDLTPLSPSSRPTKPLVWLRGKIEPIN